LLRPQTLFVLGDLALMRYDLEHAWRIFAVVAQGSAHVLVSHFYLMLQAHAFRAVCEMHLGDCKGSCALITRCMTLYRLDASSLQRYNAEDDRGLRFFAQAVHRLHAAQASAAAVPSPSSLEVRVQCAALLRDLQSCL